MGIQKTRPGDKTPGLKKRTLGSFFPLILSHLAIAGAAIYRSALFGLKGYFSLFAALRTNCRVLLHGASRPAAFFRFSGLTTGETTLRFIGVTFLLKKFLLYSGERKLFAAIAAHDLLVGKTH